MKEKIILSLARRGTGLFPTDVESEDIIKSLPYDDNFNVILNADRNARMHRAYFSLLAFVWENLPENFQKKCPKQHFYKFLKELQGRFEVIQIGKTEVKNYESISFNKMGQKRFHEVFSEDIKFIAFEVLPLLDMNDFNEILFTQYEQTLMKYNL